MAALLMDTVISPSKRLHSTLLKMILMGSLTSSVTTDKAVLSYSPSCRQIHAHFQRCMAEARIPDFDSVSSTAMAKASRGKYLDYGSLG
jgi:hypothetical protein